MFPLTVITFCSISGATGTIIYKITDSNGNVSYSYNVPNVSLTNDGVVFMPDFSKDGVENVALAHTHSNYDKDYGNGNNEFSPQDKKTSKILKMDNYVATPKGVMLKYDCENDKVLLINTNMPSDPNPENKERVNSIDSNTLPKDEPTRGLGRLIFDNIIMPLLKGSSKVKN